MSGHRDPALLRAAPALIAVRKANRSAAKSWRCRRRGVIHIVHLAGHQEPRRIAKLLIVGESGGGSGWHAGWRTWTPSAIGKVESRARMRHARVNRAVRGRLRVRGVFIDPLQNGPRGGSRTQHPLPIIGLDGRRRRRASQSIERREHRLKLDAHDGRYMGIDAHVLFDRRKESGERNAHGVQTRQHFVAAKNALHVGEKIDGRDTAFRDQLNGGAHLRSAGRVVDDAGDFARSGFKLLGGNPGNADRQTRPGEDQNAENRESCLLHFVLPPMRAGLPVLAAVLRYRLGA